MKLIGEMSLLFSIGCEAIFIWKFARGSWFIGNNDSVFFFQIMLLSFSL